MVRTKFEPDANSLDIDLRELLQKHRNSNACPNISGTGHLYQDEVRELLARARRMGTLYRNGKWVCAGSPPPSTDKHYYHCCPSGYTKTPFEDNNPCKGFDRALEKCGPLPEGATEQSAACCEAAREWVPNPGDGSDPCLIAAQLNNQAIPGMPDTILAPDIAREETGHNLILIGFAIIFTLLTGITLFVKLM